MTALPFTLNSCLQIRPFDQWCAQILALRMQPSVLEEKDQIEQEQQENEATAKRNTERIASIEDKMALKELKTLMDAPKPQPRARPIQKKTKLTIEDDDEIAEGTIESKDNEMMDVATDDNNGNEDLIESDDESIDVQPRKKHLQKMAYCKAVQDVRSANNKGGVNHNESSQDPEESHQSVITQLWHLLLTETTLSHLDLLNCFSVDVSAIKDDFAGMGKPRTGLKNLWQASCSGLKAFMQFLECPHTHPGPSLTPTTNGQGNLQEPTTVFLDSNDSLECEATFTTTKKPGGRSTTSADIMEVRNSSLSPPPPVRHLATKKRTKSLSLPPPSMQPSRATARLDTTLISSLLTDIDFGDSSPSEDIILPSAPAAPKNNKRLTTSTNVTTSNQAPPSKRAKTDSHSKGVSSCCNGSGTNHQYQSDDLPEGCQDSNAWCRMFIPSVAHWAGGDVEPWGPDNSDLRETMQEIWDHIYQGRIQHEISQSGTVMKVAKQHLMEWRGGFGVTACSILTAFFAQDADFLDHVTHVDFSKSMLKQNQFIFRDNSGLIPKNWMGMWRSPFVLQTFASHLNFTFGYIEIPTLDTKNPSAQAAFALTVYCTLQLVVNGNMTFEIIQESCGKRKGAKTDDGDVWMPVIMKGKQYSFSMGPISVLSDNNFASIVEEA
ncbi:hypothetical protein BD769DRAFT_1668457 [Suillus cothurnatus]|nr:hypothetical protein BD769DRAFT_1668457 [Suillus cothurnatus]